MGGVVLKSEIFRMISVLLWKRGGDAFLMLQAKRDMFQTNDELLRQIHPGGDALFVCLDLKCRGDEVNESHRSRMADGMAATANAGDRCFCFGS